MKPTKSILILLSLFLIFSCDDNSVEPLVCDEGLTNVDGECIYICEEGVTECYYQGDLDVLQDFIDGNDSLIIEGAAFSDQDILNFISNEKYDLVVSKALLIHINPKKLNQAYRIIYNSCKRNKYILFAEYYNPYPIKIDYRRYKNVLFKRDFAGEFIDKFKKIKLVDYGFIYHGDKFSQDDITWFLLQKK